MNKSHWFKDNQKGNFSNDKQDTFDPKRRYVGIRLQQGVPLLDRDWNELEDIRRYEEQMLRKWYVGDGSPDNGFEISPLDPPKNDFRISPGRYLVDGFEVVNEKEIIYSEQEGVLPLKGPGDIVQLEVWIEEVTSDEGGKGNKGDPSLKNDADIEMETCIRHHLRWRVRQKATLAVDQIGHHYQDIAKIKWSDGVVSEVTDLRRTGLALHLIRDTLHLIRDRLATNQMADSLHRHSKLVATDGSPDPALSIDSSGNVGIGTASPAAKLQVLNIDQNANGNTLVLGPTNASNLRLGYHSDYSWIQSHGDKPLAINPLGNNVGIGTTNPQDKLDVNGAIRFNGNSQRRVYGDSRAGSNAVILTGRWDELEIKGRVIDWTGSNLHIGYQNDHSADAVYIGGGEGKLKFVQINHAAQKNAINTDNIGLELQSPDGGGVIYGHDMNHSIFLRIGRDGAGDVTDYHQYGTHRFFTGGALQDQQERMRITSDGRICIGTSKPSLKVGIGGTEGQNVLHIASDFGLSGDNKLNLIRFGNDGDYQILHKASGAFGRNTLALHCHANDAIGIYSTGWNPLFEVEGGTGRYYFRGGQFTPSDFRLKTNVLQLTNMLSKVGRIRGVSFEWNKLYDSTLGGSNRERQIGLIAQEVQEVLPELVSSWGKEKYLGIDYNRIVVVLVEAIKELKAKVEALERKVWAE